MFQHPPRFINRGITYFSVNDVATRTVSYSGDSAPTRDCRKSEALDRALDIGKKSNSLGGAGHQW
jgi:hypothetical protein